MYVKVSLECFTVQTVYMYINTKLKISVFVQRSNNPILDRISEIYIQFEDHNYIKDS